MTNAGTIDCQEALRQLLTYLDAELPEPDRVRVDEHLRRCRSCWSRAEFERRLKGQLAELGKAPVRPELENRIRRLLTSNVNTEGG
jgi:anti-sigma factor (TIGR02949 family)